MQELAVESFVATDCEGMARVDFFVRPDGEVVVNELNTIPGFTATSVYAKLFDAAGIPYAELLDRLVAARPRAPRAAPVAVRACSPSGIRQRPNPAARPAPPARAAPKASASRPRGLAAPNRGEGAVS